MPISAYNVESQHYRTSLLGCIICMYACKCTVTKTSQSFVTVNAPNQQGRILRPRPSVSVPVSARQWFKGQCRRGEACPALQFSSAPAGVSVGLCCHSFAALPDQKGGMTPRDSRDPGTALISSYFPTLILVCHRGIGFLSIHILFYKRVLCKGCGSDHPNINNVQFLDI